MSDQEPEGLPWLAYCMEHGLDPFSPLDRAPNAAEEMPPPPKPVSVTKRTKQMRSDNRERSGNGALHDDIEVNDGARLDANDNASTQSREPSPTPTESSQAMFIPDPLRHPNPCDDSESLLDLDWDNDGTESVASSEISVSTKGTGRKRCIRGGKAKSTQRSKISKTQNQRSSAATRFQGIMSGIPTQQKPEGTFNAVDDARNQRLRSLLRPGNTRSHSIDITTVSKNSIKTLPWKQRQMVTPDPGSAPATALASPPPPPPLPLASPMNLRSAEAIIAIAEQVTRLPQSQLQLVGGGQDVLQGITFDRWIGSVEGFFQAPLRELFMVRQAEVQEQLNIVRNLQLEYLRVQGENQELRKDGRILQNQANMWQKTSHRLEEQNKAKDGEIMDLQSDLSGLVEENEDLKSKLADANVNNAVLEGEVSGLENKISELEEE